MKIVKLCKEGSCCPEVNINESQVKIGEKDNVCILTKGQWEILREKVINGEL